MCIIHAAAAVKHFSTGVGEYGREVPNAIGPIGNPSTRCYRMLPMKGTCRIRIANVQDQGVRAFRKSGRIEGCRVVDAVRRTRKSLIDAGLSGGVIKQRVARKGGGRSGGFRTIMLFRRSELAFFVYGFAKSVRKPLRQDELLTFRLLADEYLALRPASLDAALSAGAIVEVNCDE